MVIPQWPSREWYGAETRTMESWVMEGQNGLGHQPNLQWVLGGDTREGTLGWKKELSPGKPGTLSEGSAQLFRGLLEFHYPVHTVQMGI